MITKSQASQLTELLRLPEATVEDMAIVDGVGLFFVIRSTRRDAECPHCGKRSRYLHANHRYNWAEGTSKLLDWMAESATFFKRSCGTIARWFDEVISYFELRITNGVVEGINNKFKLIKRLGYGFSNFDNFKLRALLSWAFPFKSAQSDRKNQKSSLTCCRSLGICSD
jgi:transposase